MKRRSAAALFLGLLAWSTPALAHAPIVGIGGVFGGVLHAVAIPEHGLALLALALVLGQQPWTWRRNAMGTFLVALACGLVAAGFALGESLAADILLSAAGLLGLLLAAAWTPPSLGTALAAIAGVALALDSRPEVASTGEAIRMLIGSGIGAALAVAFVSEAAFRVRGQAHLMASRVLGSWIAAISILTLSLRVVTQMTVG